FKTPPRGVVAVLLHALNLLIVRQLVDDIEHFASQVELRIAPPLCPLTVTAYDFSQTAELIRRAEAKTRLWLKQDAPPAGASDPPPELLPHRHGDLRE